MKIGTNMNMAAMDAIRYNSFGMSEFEQELISDILAEHDMKACSATENKEASVLSLGSYITYYNCNYTIKIGLGRIELKDISDLISELDGMCEAFWASFAPRDKFWYAKSYLCCLSADHARKILVFE